jgi:hypothetical protein
MCPPNIVDAVAKLHKGRFTRSIPCPCRSSQGHSTARPSLDGRAVLWPWEERHGRSMAWQVWIRHGRTVNQMGKTHSKQLEARHGRGTAWVRHAMCESALKRLLVSSGLSIPPCAWNNSAATRRSAWNLILKYFSKICWEGSVFIKIYDKDSGYFARRPIYIYFGVSLRTS